MLKKQTYSEEEIPIFDEAVIYKRGDYYQFRMWLNKEGKYARKSLRTRSKSTAIAKAEDYYHEIVSNQKMGKTHFSLTVKEGVERYIANREKDVESKLIVSGRLSTIKTHLQHFLNFIGRDTKLKELEHTDCEDYFYERTKNSSGKVKQVTIQNEQSTINACLKYLFRNNETQIDSFYFKKLPKLDRNNEAIQRATFTNDEYDRLCRVMRTYCAKSNKKIDDDERLIRNIVRHYVLIAANSGLRVGEQRQLRWSDVNIEYRESDGNKRVLAKIRVRAETSKVRNSRTLYCRGGEYFERLKELTNHTSDDSLIFSKDGQKRL